MGIQTQVLEALRRLAAVLAGDLPVGVGPLPAQEGLSLAVSSGRTTAVTLAGGVTAVLDVTLTLKHTDAYTAMDALCSVQEGLARAQPLPAGEGWQVLDIRPASAPGYLNREGGHWLYGGAVAVEYSAD